MKKITQKKKIAILLGGLMISSVLFGGCSVSSNTIKKGISISSTPQNVWMWDATNVSNINVIKKLKSLNTDTVYVNTGWAPESNEFYLKKHSLMYASFIESANDNKIKVDALLGNPDWALSSNYVDFENQINDILSFNEKFSYGFNAIHLDIEPYLIKDWDTNKSKYLTSYIENLKKIRTLIDNHNIKTDDTLALVVDVPFWFSQKEFSINNENILDLLFSVVDGVTIMNYTKNQTDFVSRAVDILKIADKYDNKSVTVGMEFQPSYTDITLYDVNPDKLVDYVKNSLAELKKYDSFKGLSIHEYNSYLDYVTTNIK